MRKMIVRFVIASVVFTVTLFLAFWLYDLIAEKEGNLVKEIKDALIIGILSGFFIVFLTNFFKKEKDNG